MKKMPFHQKQQKRTDSDRISCLADSILHHILSFLPAKDAVRTSVLSKEWQKLWISLPYLNFDDAHFGFTNREISFWQFLDNFMLYHDTSSIVRFRLRWNSHDHAYKFDEWITAAISGGVQELDIAFFGASKFDPSLPSSLSISNTLVTLKLAASLRSHRFPDYFCFPKLRNMNLHYITLARNFSNHLLKSPNLEKLFLQSCVVGDYSLSGSHNNIDNDNDDLGTLSNLDVAYLGLGRPHFGYAERVSLTIRKLSKVNILHLHQPCVQVVTFS